MNDEIKNLESIAKEFGCELEKEIKFDRMMDGFKGNPGIASELNDEGNISRVMFGAERVPAMVAKLVQLEWKGLRALFLNHNKLTTVPPRTGTVNETRIFFPGSESPEPRPAKRA